MSSTAGESSDGNSSSSDDDHRNKSKGLTYKAEEEGHQRAYTKMSTKEKETIKRRMAEIDEAGAGDQGNTPPSLNPM